MLINKSDRAQQPSPAGPSRALLRNRTECAKSPSTGAFHISSAPPPRPSKLFESIQLR